MEYTDLINAIEQYKSEGKDLNAVVAATQSMLGAGKTPLGLNQWRLSDKPRMEEFNEDNRIVDDKLQQLFTGMDAKADKAELYGSLNKPQNIPMQSDIDHYTQPGFYFNGAGAENIANKPMDTGSFSLLVECNYAYGDGVKQTFTSHGDASTYIRVGERFSTHGWNPWNKVAFI